MCRLAVVGLKSTPNANLVPAKPSKAAAGIELNMCARIYPRLRNGNGWATALLGEMILRVWDVEHGACAMVQHSMGQHGGKLAMIDSGSTDDLRPSNYIRHHLGRTNLNYLCIINADQDHMSDLLNGGSIAESGLPGRSRACLLANFRLTSRQLAPALRELSIPQFCQHPAFTSPRANRP
jgi:hypothetical protein